MSMHNLLENDVSLMTSLGPVLTSLGVDGRFAGVAGAAGSPVSVRRGGLRKLLVAEASDVFDRGCWWNVSVLIASCGREFDDALDGVMKFVTCIRFGR